MDDYTEWAAAVMDGLIYRPDKEFTLSYNKYGLIANYYPRDSCFLSLQSTDACLNSLMKEFAESWSYAYFHNGLLYIYQDIWDQHNVDFLQDQLPILLAALKHRVLIRELKPELIAAAWHPDRLMAWVEAGWDPDD